MTATLNKLIVTMALVGTALVAVCQKEPIPHDSLGSYSAKALQKDFSILIKALQTTYPSLYRFTDSAIISKYLNDQLNAINHPETEAEFYRLVALTCAKVNDEHLIPNPSKEYYSSLKNAHHYFPFSLKIIDRRFYILEAARSSGPLPAGTEIISINGRSVEEILSKLLPTISSDGYGQTFNIRHLEDYSMTQVGNLFDLNYPIFVEDTNAFRIEFISPDVKSEKQIETIAGLDYKSYREFYHSRIKYKAPLEFKYVKNIAYLRISSFLRWHRAAFKQDFNVLYDSVFKDLNIKKTDHLILDLRNNEGGDETGQKLLTYLLNKPYKYYDSVEEKFTGRPPVAEYLENDKDLFFADSLVYHTSSGMYQLKKTYPDHMSSLDEQQPNANAYKGKLYVLINGASGSMASVVSSLLKGNARATFIGEESGGAMEGTTSLRSVQLVLPNSKIRIEMPLIKTHLSVQFTKGRGVSPDYNITEKMDDILKGIDTHLEFVIGLIEGKK